MDNGFDDSSFDFGNDDSAHVPLSPVDRLETPVCVKPHLFITPTTMSTATNVHKYCATDPRLMDRFAPFATPKRLVNSAKFDIHRPGGIYDPTPTPQAPRKPRHSAGSSSVASKSGAPHGRTSKLFDNLHIDIDNSDDAPLHRSFDLDNESLDGEFDLNNKSHIFMGDELLEGEDCSILVDERFLPPLLPVAEHQSVHSSMGPPSLGPTVLRKRSRDEMRDDDDDDDDYNGGDASGNNDGNQVPGFGMLQQSFTEENNALHMQGAVTPAHRDRVSSIFSPSFGNGGPTSRSFGTVLTSRDNIVANAPVHHLPGFFGPSCLNATSKKALSTCEMRKRRKYGL